MSLEEAERWPDLISIVRDKVKPERDKNNREVRRKYWWRFGEVAPALYEAIAPLKRCLVTARVTKHLCFSFQPSDRVFSEATYVFPLESHASFATLQSRIHEKWARLLSSSLEDRLRYAASDCFETFPFPTPDPRTVIPALEDIGQRLYDARAKYMVDENVGLTITYNRLKDPACVDARILALRELHEEMDQKVLCAYAEGNPEGRWNDVRVPPFCPRNDADQKALETFETAVIDRLFALNETRAQDEARKGLGQRPAKKTPAPEKPVAKKPPSAKTNTNDAPKKPRGRPRKTEGQLELAAESKKPS
jgi:hypothetical protein